MYMDGCFDMMHYGHANAMRQAKALGDELVLGLIPDSEILMAKGPPVMNDAERKTMVESVKWVDEVIEGVALASALALCATACTCTSAPAIRCCAAGDASHTYSNSSLTLFFVAGPLVLFAVRSLAGGKYTVFQAGCWSEHGSAIVKYVPSATGTELWHARCGLQLSNHSHHPRDGSAVPDAATGTCMGCIVRAPGMQVCHTSWGQSFWQSCSPSTR